MTVHASPRGGGAGQLVTTESRQQPDLGNIHGDRGRAIQALRCGLMCRPLDVMRCFFSEVRA